jgi:hypothetical protein
MDYTKIYGGWNSLPDCRIRLDLGDGVEHLWGKMLPDGTFGINNMPLDASYQWQDIVSSQELRNSAALIHRRWKCKTYFCFKEDPKGDQTLRQTIAETLQARGLYPGFWTTGVGYALFKEDLGEEASQKVISDALDGKAELVANPNLS